MTDNLPPQDPQQDTSDVRNALTRLENAIAFRGLLDDPRWARFIAPILTDTRDRAARRTTQVANTQDGAFEAAYHRGMMKAMDIITAKFQALYGLAVREIEDARRTRPV